MWIDNNGVVHTVALPEPAEVMTEEFRQSLLLLFEAHEESLRQTVEDAMERFFATDLHQQPDEPEYVAAAPPIAILRGTVLTPDDVSRAIASVPHRWRLDAAEAIDDFLD